MTGNFHVRFGERGGETRWLKSQKVRSAPTLRSGTFPIGAYQYLLDWHRDWYSENDPGKWAKSKKPPIFQGKDGWQLTVAKKKEILLNNIYGVDIDPQAVEVTKLSLLLKLVENPGQLDFMEERILPHLGANIKCGNSLIGPDYYNAPLRGEGHQLTMLVDEEERYRVNAFDWKSEFPQVFAGGGFDVVVGNPPYIRIQILQETSQIDVEFYKKRYKSASKGNYDVYVVFVEKGLSLLNNKGRLGFILPHKFFNGKYGEPLRSVIAGGKHLGKVVHFGDQQVFENATTYTCLMFLDKAGHDEFEFEKVQSLEGWRVAQTSEVSETTEVLMGKINAERVTGNEWNFSTGKDADLFEKLEMMPTKLGNIANIFVGLQTSADTVFLFKECKKSDSPITTVQSKELSESVDIETNILKSVVRSGEIGRYWANPTAEVLFPYETTDGKFKLMPENQLKKDFPKAWNYLLKNKELLAGREHGKFKDIGWYQLYPKNLDTWEQPKIMLPYMITRLSAFYDENNFYFVNVTTGGFGITIKEEYGNHKYITGLLNSNLLDWFMKKVSTTFHGGYFAANKQFLVQLPIRTINFSDAEDKARHDKMVSLVERMLELTPLLSPRAGGSGGPRTPGEVERVRREIEAADRAIDRLVYELYGLTEDEVKVVEGSLT